MLDQTDQEPNVIECRICHSKTTTDLILSPCHCRGSLAFVHFQCLERWLNSSSRNSCELCSFPFSVIEARRFTCLQSVRVWFRHPEFRSFLICDLAIALVLTLMTVTLVATSLFGLSRFVKEGREQGIETFWSEGVIHFFLAIILVFYVLTIYSMARDHVIPWYSWWTHCNNVRLVMDKHSPTLEPTVNVNTDSNTQNVSTQFDHIETDENSNAKDNLEVTIQT